MLSLILPSSLPLSTVSFSELWPLAVHCGPGAGIVLLMGHQANSSLTLHPDVHTAHIPSFPHAGVLSSHIITRRGSTLQSGILTEK